MTISPVIRVAFGLVCLTLGILLTADIFNLTPLKNEEAKKMRHALAESVGVQLSVAARSNDLSLMRATLSILLRQNPELLSAGLRRGDGRLLLDLQQHGRAWGQESAQGGHGHVTAPVLNGRSQFAELELRFEPLAAGIPWLGGLSPWWIGYIALAGFVGYGLLLRRCFRFMDPTTVVPGRVTAALNTLVEGVLVLDNDGRIVLANSAFTDIADLPLSKLMGKEATAFKWMVPRSDQHAADLPWMELLNGGTESRPTALAIKRPDGTESVFMVSGSAIMDDDGVQRGVMVSFEDITELEHKHAEMEEMCLRLEESKEHISRKNEELHVLATTDPLTGCLNRRHFFEQFGSLFYRAKSKGDHICCIMVDIDHFKSVNDTYGHAMGDEVIKLLADLLHRAVRRDDLVSRYGGEEFCMLLPGMNIAQALAVAERCREAVKHQNDLPVKVTASFGVASLDCGAATPEEMVDKADKALYISKESGRNRVTPWDALAQRQMQPLQVAQQERMEMEDAMQDALRNDEFELYFQPQYSAAGDMIGAEALIRWNRPGYGLVSPAAFISHAEASGQILEIGEWVLHEACDYLAKWTQLGLIPEFSRLAVNVSPRQFGHPGFVDTLDHVLRRSGADPSYLELELTENMLINSVDEAVEKMEELKQKGIRFSIDDFGTGYSSLTYLRHLPLNQLKIDQSFVKDLLVDKSDAAIVATIIAMAESLELETIAEGVETVAELELLRKMGCDTFQGYYFSKPVPATELQSQICQPIRAVSNR